jgi:MOSC domain-containing protein YiiM
MVVFLLPSRSVNKVYYFCKTNQHIMEIAALLNSLPQIGQVDWIGIRPQKNTPVQALEEVLAVHEKGLSGDHYRGTSGKREVTLIQAEHLGVVSKLLQQDHSISQPLPAAT